MANEISLCMIVKNEEENLPRCLESVKDLVDEIIIVDTGSIDKTVEIAKSYGAKVYYFKWCNDFSAARNESLKYATKDWILIMDGDDEFCSEDKNKFRNLVNNLDDNILYYFETLSYTGYHQKGFNISVNLNPRLFKNNYGYYYEGEIHNQIRNSKFPIKGRVEEVRIYHYGYLQYNMIKKDKTNRNIKILKNLIKKEPENKFHYFNLGNEYCTVREYDKALKYFYEVYKEFNPKVAYSPKLILKIVTTNFILKKLEEALKFINIGLSYYPKFTELHYFKGIILDMKNKPSLAIESFQKCIELGESDPFLKNIYGVGSFLTFDWLSKIYMKIKDYNTAYKYCIEAIKSKPDYIVPLYNITHILKEENTPLDEFKNEIESFFKDFPNAYFIISDLFYSEGYYETALEYLEKYESKKSLSEYLMFFKAKCLIRTSRFDECIKYSDTISENNLYYSQFLSYKIICLIIMDKYDLALITINKFNENNLSHRDKKAVQVYKQLVNLFVNEDVDILSEDDNEKDYTSFIFEICEIFLINKEFDKLEKSLNLFNLISDKSVLLQLGKLYYKYGYKNMAKEEIIQSIKMFEVMDDEGLDILKVNL
ncbi:glycosyltransferase [Haloimpatiens sp. FM7330]|uniref:tetratricopeptide repeat-containing glycosyltransferase family 2 protein n=1 Tax=Haloimpatiens sp. FM7330 TaxID=3298610 RepID=UPI00363FDA3C